MDSTERIRYKCKSCKFEFYRRSGQEIGKCPYCGKEGMIEKAGNFASQVLDEVSRLNMRDE
jgi:ribosomal protein L37AE/L43A